MSTAFREELIQSVHKEGQQEYRETLERIGRVEGREGMISGLALRVIKGIRRLELSTAQFTNEGIATADRAIVDCSAAMVRRRGDSWERYSGKDSPHPMLIHSLYDDVRQAFSLWSEGIGIRTVEPKDFPASILAPRQGEIISVDFKASGRLQGVLEDGPLTDHIRECLAEVERDVESIGILLRHPSFHRLSDTRSPGVDGINTLYTDGAQMHAMNRRTIRDRQNHADIGRYMLMESYRAGIELEGENFPPNIEDLISEIHVYPQEDFCLPLHFTSLTPRCKVPQRDINTGAVQQEPKQWNLRHQPRRPWDGAPTMGANVDMWPYYDGIIVRVGDPVSVISEKTTWTK